MRSIGLLALLALLALARPTAAGKPSADTVETYARQLEDGDGYKVRLSAAMWLARTHDPRAIKAMIRAVQVEPVRSVRRVAAVSLGKMVNASTPERLRARAREALAVAAERDRDSKVRGNARQALARLARLPGASAAKKRASGVFVHIGKPTDLTRTAPKPLPAHLRKTVARTLHEQVPDYLLRWPTGRPPTQGELTSSDTRGYFVGASVMKFQVKRMGQGAEVRCSVAMFVNPWDGSDSQEKWSEKEAASATGSGKVMSAFTKRGIAQAKCDCVLAVAEQMTTREVVPFLERLVDARQ